MYITCVVGVHSWSSPNFFSMIHAGDHWPLRALWEWLHQTCGGVHSNSRWLGLKSSLLKMCYQRSVDPLQRIIAPYMVYRCWFENPSFLLIQSIYNLCWPNQKLQTVDFPTSTSGGNAVRWWQRKTRCWCREDFREMCTWYEVHLWKVCICVYMCIQIHVIVCLHVYTMLTSIHRSMQNCILVSRIYLYIIFVSIFVCIVYVCMSLYLCVNDGTHSNKGLMPF